MPHPSENHVNEAVSFGIVEETRVQEKTTSAGYLTNLFHLYLSMCVYVCIYMCFPGCLVSLCVLKLTCVYVHVSNCCMFQSSCTYVYVHVSVLYVLHMSVAVLHKSEGTCACVACLSKSMHMCISACVCVCSMIH